MVIENFGNTIASIFWKSLLGETDLTYFERQDYQYNKQVTIRDI